MLFCEANSKIKRKYRSIHSYTNEYNNYSLLKVHEYI